MGNSSVRGEGTRRRGPHARDLGWDDSLYEDEAGRVPGARTALDDEQDRESERDTAAEGSGPHRRPAPTRRAKRGRRRILRGVAVTVSVVVLGTAGAGYLYYEHLNSNIRKGQRTSGDSDVKKSAPNAAGQTPLNVLLIGSDSRNSTENLELGGSKKSVGAPPLADVQMLLHVSADRKNASVVSIPRDTKVEIPACTDPKTGEEHAATRDLINATLGRGGPGCTLATWQELTGVYIDHWMMVDFAGVVDMADAIGGAEVCVNHNVYDGPKPGVPGGSGLRLTEGSHEIQGVKALQWLRTRHAFESDFGRSKAQHMYMNSVIRKLKEQNAFTDGGQLMDLAETATRSLQVSEEIGTVKKLFDLGMTLKDVPTDRIAMLTMPRVPDPANPKNHVLPAPGEADRLWEMLRDDVPVDGKAPTSKPKKPAAPKDPAADPADIGVMVRNGTGADGPATPQRANAVASLLAQQGFTGAKADSTPDPQERTQVLFPSADLQGDAHAVAKALGVPTSAVKRSTDVSGVTLVVGADWRTGDTFPKAEPAAGPPKNTETVMGDDKNACMDIYAPYRF
ncbi:LCP family protein required for cell wall assembly [Streptomyces sp. V4I23]|uniref:LCP family protein n=1 Tax=Streptomyces sp. V4I23 TaxID=3042282 RepID=UPI002781B189|nr:LCP family protein [Streptomyces sp. V4I23]MDQ1010400.1 LCP family protein required for cell wall assembly [Streptomyces sp. V4I23]